MLKNDNIIVFLIISFVYPSLPLRKEPQDSSMKKVNKYLHYIKILLRRPDKGSIIKGLFEEIQQKGLLVGLQSFLHQNVEFFFPGYNRDAPYEPIISLQKEHEHLKIALPFVPNPKVSIIIPTYNELEHVYYCVRSILEGSGYTDYEVIIANDNSKQDITFLSKHIHNLIIVSNETNLGFLRNCNNAAKHAKGEYLVFLNNDTVTERDWLHELLDVFERFEHVGIVGSKLIYADKLLQEAGGILWQDGSAWNYGNRDNPDKPEYNYLKEVDYVSGASMMVLRKLWDEIGGFDERYVPAYNEDSDLCMEAHKRGYGVWYQPFSVVIHYEGISHGRDVSKGIKKYQQVNQQKFIEKWTAELQQKSRKGANVFLERQRGKQHKYILVIDHELPMVDTNAGARTMSNFVDTFLSLGYKVAFWSAHPYPPQHYKKELQEKGVEVIWGERADYLKANMHYFSAILLSRSSICVPHMITLRNNDYCGHIIYYGHDLGFLRLEQEVMLNRDVAYDLQSKIVKAQEDFMYEQADHSLMISFEEMEFLKTYISQPLHYIPPYYFEVEAQVPSFEERSGIMFIGGFNHTPNQDAMRWFLNEVYEPLHDKGIPFTIAGSNVPAFIIEYKRRYKLLQIVSDISVENLEKLYASVKVAIVPLRIGAGVKGKVIEAMSKGVPVAGSFLAFEGIPKEDGFVYKGCNTATELQQQILKIYTERDYWENLSVYGQSYVKKHFNKHIMKRTFESILRLPVKKRVVLKAIK